MQPFSHISPIARRKFTLCKGISRIDGAATEPVVGETLSMGRVDGFGGDGNGGADGACSCRYAEH